MARKKKRGKKVAGVRVTPRHRTRRRRIGAVGEGSNAIMDVAYMVGGVVAANMLFKTVLSGMLGNMTAQTKAMVYAGGGIALVEMSKSPMIKKMGEGIAVYGGISFAQGAGLISGFNSSGNMVSGMQPNQMGYVRNSSPLVGAVPDPEAGKKSLMMLGAICSQH